jgi:hypothetical protein
VCGAFTSPGRVLGFYLVGLGARSGIGEVLAWP